MIADMISNKRLNSVVTELFIKGRKVNISLVFITQSYFKVPKHVRLNCAHIFVMKIPNNRELQQTAINHSSDVDFKDFMKVYNKWTAGIKLMIELYNQIIVLEKILQNEYIIKSRGLRI